jgi:hypothetical protein
LERCPIQGDIKYSEGSGSEWRQMGARLEPGTRTVKAERTLSCQAQECPLSGLRVNGSSNVREFIVSREGSAPEIGNDGRFFGAELYREMRDGIEDMRTDCAIARASVGTMRTRGNQNGSRDSSTSSGR